MELSKIISLKDKKHPEYLRLEEILNSLVNLYAASKENFIKFFERPDPDIVQFKIWFNKTPFLHINTELSDLCYEIAGYFPKKKENKKKNNKKIYRSFTLRDINDLNIFESFLDSMLKLLNLSPKHFAEWFPKCPVVFWDKIEELRDTSIKYNRDSEQFIRCLIKSKAISYAYSDIIDKMLSLDEDFFDSYEELEDENISENDLNELINDNLWQE